MSNHFIGYFLIVVVPFAPLNTGVYFINELLELLFELGVTYLNLVFAYISSLSGCLNDILFCSIELVAFVG